MTREDLKFQKYVTDKVFKEFGYDGITTVQINGPDFTAPTDPTLVTVRFKLMGNLEDSLKPFSTQRGQNNNTEEK